MPPATVTPARDAVILANGQATPVQLRVRAAREALSGEVSLSLPPGWRSEPPRAPVVLAKAGEEVTVSLRVTAPPGAGAEELTPVFEEGGRGWSWREELIDHAHIPVQVVLRPARVRLVPAALVIPKGRVGYVAGSGDTIAEDLAHVGVAVEVLDDEALRTGELSRYSAIVTGIRAFNTREVLKSAGPRLMQYVERGGTLVVQYNTHNRLAPLEVPIGPFPLELGRGRVTDQRAPLSAPNPRHPLLLSPNRIEPADFEGWVQERGLYFAEKWDARYEPVLTARDPGEEPLAGGLLAARHGKGRYVYTGLAFFRQLPAGVPGAYRLFANLLGWRR